MSREGEMSVRELLEKWEARRDSHADVLRATKGREGPARPHGMTLAIEGCIADLRAALEATPTEDPAAKGSEWCQPYAQALGLAGPPIGAGWEPMQVLVVQPDPMLPDTALVQVWNRRKPVVGAEGWNPPKYEHDGRWPNGMRPVVEADLVKGAKLYNTRHPGEPEMCWYLGVQGDGHGIDISPENDRSSVRGCQRGWLWINLLDGPTWPAPVELPTHDGQWLSSRAWGGWVLDSVEMGDQGPYVVVGEDRGLIRPSLIRYIPAPPVPGVSDV